MIDQVCIGLRPTVTRSIRHRHRQNTIRLHTAQAVLSVPVQTQMRTGRRFRILLSAEGYRIESLKEITVSSANKVALISFGIDRSNTSLGKKLKKRLEDLERRAGSSSASPEQRHEELAQLENGSLEQAAQFGSQRQRSGSNQLRRDRTPEVLDQQYVLPSDDRSMFSQQFTRQLSTSPPPFSYASIPASESGSYSTYQQTASYCSMPPNGMDMPLYPQYLPPPQQNYQHVVPSMATPPIKQEFYNDDEMNPFSMSYASMAGVDVSAAQSYQDVAAYVSTKPHHPPYQRSYSYPQWPRNTG